MELKLNNLLNYNLWLTWILHGTSRGKFFKTRSYGKESYHGIISLVSKKSDVHVTFFKGNQELG
jgi:hypothetical protein